jgi:hypothetical protein
VSFQLNLAQPSHISDCEKLKINSVACLICRLTNYSSTMNKLFWTLTSGTNCRLVYHVIIQILGFSGSLLMLILNSTELV